MAPVDYLEAVLGQHTLLRKTICGAVSIPVPHGHLFSESGNSVSPPLRVLKCSQPDGHGGRLHKDTICCYNFTEFADWQVAEREPYPLDTCSCGRTWPCETVRAIQNAEGS